jgi:transposase
MPPPGPLDACNAKQAVWWYIRSPDELTAAEQAQLVFLRQVHPCLEMAYGLVQAFVDMVRKREGERLEAWVEQARESPIPELVRIGRGVERDQTAVQAALQLPHSNGVLEGHVHRLKLIKRQGYGRAAFPLLRRRILYATQ